MLDPLTLCLQRFLWRSTIRALQDAWICFFGCLLLVILVICENLWVFVVDIFDCVDLFVRLKIWAILKSLKVPP